MTIVQNFVKGLSNIPDAIRILMFGLSVVIIAGVLTSPPDAVHGINHDYHAVWQQWVYKQKSTPANSIPACFTGALFYISSGSCLIEKGSDLSGTDTRFPVLAIIQTWRLLL